MKKRIMKPLIVSAGLLAAVWGAPVQAGEVDLLVDKLVEKDVLSPLEAQLLLDETRTQVAGDNASGKNEYLPSWIQTMTLKGDVRLRYQNEQTDTTSGASTTTAKRERGRVRFRLGAQARANDQWTVGFGLASGSSDPRSTNQTMQDNFSSKGINLDYAYATYMPTSTVSFSGGKMLLKETIWTPSDLLWDSDISPEGVAVNADWFGAMSGVDVWLNAGALVVDEVSSGADPKLLFIQPGLTWDVTENMSWKNAVTKYWANGIQGFAYGNIVDGGGTNTLLNGDFKYDYDAVVLSTEYGINLQEDAEVRELINYVSLFAEYVQNPDPSDEDTGYLFGVSFGDKKVKDPGSWQAKIMQRRLGKDAWLDFLPDSDVLGGITDVKSLELILQYALAKNVTVGVDYYNSKTDKASKKKEQDLVQVDCVVAF